MGLLIGFMPLMGWRAIKGPILESCVFNRVMDYNYLVFLFGVTIILPALFMATFYAHIYTVIIKQVSITNIKYFNVFKIVYSHIGNVYMYITPTTYIYCISDIYKVKH